jgi:hypothetical protein
MAASTVAIMNRVVRKREMCCQDERKEKWVYGILVTLKLSKRTIALPALNPTFPEP